MKLRERIFNVVDRDRNGDLPSRIYDGTMIVMIFASIIPLMFVDSYPVFRPIEIVTVIAFIADYVLRWANADYLLHRGWRSFLIYPFTFMAIIDFLSILPGLNLLNKSLKLLRLPRLFKMIRLVKLLRYSDRITMLLNVMRKERRVLLSVLVLALFYIFVTALIMFNTEPHVNPATGAVTFRSFFDALYWSTVTLTTVGYGDLCPVTDVGRVVSMLSAIFGVAIIALPSGVITASYMEELNKKRNSDE